MSSCPSCGTATGDVSNYCPSCGATLARGDQDEYIGRTLAKKYKVEALIGEGGMGKVYRARQEALDKLVVLKVLRRSLLNDERTVARFKREAKAASRLNHPNSISILDFGQAEDGALFIAMEFVPGQDLHTVLSKEWPLSEPRIARIVSQVLSALNDAHGAGVIHRDLKPENIMVEQRRNEPDCVKVLDFGIAKIQDGGNDDGPALTRTGFVCGTPEYMSPEQARGASLDHRSDLYAVGVILYQLVTGRLPFESDTAVGFATKHLTEEPVSPSRRRPEVRVSTGLERLIMRALAKSPDDRPQDAESFRAELLQVAQDRPERSDRLERAERAERPERERRTAAPASGRRQANGLAPLPRRGTPPPKQVSTEITDTGWRGEAELTVRAPPERLQSSPRTSTERTHAAPAPQRERERERSSTASISAMRAAPERSGPPVLNVPLSDKTEAIILGLPRPTPESVPASTPELDGGGGFGVLKAFVLTLALGTLSVLGYWLYTSYVEQANAVPYKVKDAPVPGGDSGLYSPEPIKPLYEQDIPTRRRDAREAERYRKAGYEAYKNGDLAMAATQYRNAFGQNPLPELSLTLGEVYWARGHVEESRGWWRRHLRDDPGSKARALLLLKDPGLVPSATARP